MKSYQQKFITQIFAHSYRSYKKLLHIQTHTFHSHIALHPYTLQLLLLLLLLFMPKHRFTPSEEQQLAEALNSHKKPKQIQKELFPDLELNIIRNKINRIRSDKNTDRPAADASDRGACNACLYTSF
jgi:hypothetical protein